MEGRFVGFHQAVCKTSDVAKNKDFFPPQIVTN